MTLRAIPRAPHGHATARAAVTPAIPRGGAASADGTPIGLLLVLTRSSAAPAPTTNGTPIGLLLVLTKVT